MLLMQGNLRTPPVGSLPGRSQVADLKDAAGSVAGCHVRMVVGYQRARSVYRR